MLILGFKPYHLFECFTVHGVPHMEIFKEAIISQYNRLSGVKRFNRADCDKWLAGYDVSAFPMPIHTIQTKQSNSAQCLVEIPSYMGMDVMEAYVEDPNVKFILTERKPEKWAASVNKTAAQVAKSGEEFPMNILKHFDPFLNIFIRINQLVYGAMAGCTQPGDPDNEEMLCKYYTE